MGCARVLLVFNRPDPTFNYTLHPCLVTIYIGHLYYLVTIFETPELLSIFKSILIFLYAFIICFIEGSC